MFVKKVEIVEEDYLGNVYRYIKEERVDRATLVQIRKGSNALFTIRNDRSLEVYKNLNFEKMSDIVWFNNEDGISIIDSNGNEVANVYYRDKYEDVLVIDWYTDDWSGRRLYDYNGSYLGDSFENLKTYKLKIATCDNLFHEREYTFSTNIGWKNFVDKYSADDVAYVSINGNVLKDDYIFEFEIGAYPFEDTWKRYHHNSNVNNIILFKDEYVKNIKRIKASEIIAENAFRYPRYKGGEF